MTIPAARNMERLIEI